MELKAPQGLFAVRRGGDGAVFTLGEPAETRPQDGHAVAVAHPGEKIPGHAREEGIITPKRNTCAAVFPVGKGLHLAAVKKGELMKAVADPQNRQAAGEHPGAGPGTALPPGGMGRTGKNEPLHVIVQVGFDGGAAGNNLGVDTEIPDAAPDELGGLAAEIEYQDGIQGSSRMKVSSRRGPTENPVTGTPVNSSMN